MTHVLLEKNLGPEGEIRTRLFGWGMTLGEFDPGDPVSSWPSIQEGDLVILSAESALEIENRHSEVARGSDPSLPLAPVILLGVSGSLLLTRNAWQALDSLEPDEDVLRQAMQRALEQGAVMRHGPAEEPEREEFLSFLSHEMRSPLTAAKTALEILDGDLAELESENPGTLPSRKMVSIALRNLGRLHRTVEWSQDMLGRSPLNGDVNPQDWALADLRARLEKHFRVQWAVAQNDGVMNLDPAALVSLLQQIGRALEYAYPGCPQDLKVEPLADRSGALGLTLLPAQDNVKSRAPRVSRLGLSCHSGEDSSPAKELPRLLDFVVSRALVSRLGVDLEILETSSGTPGVRVCLPAPQPACSAAQPVARLLPSA